MPKFENSTRILQFIFASWWLSVTFCWNEVLTILITSASAWSSARQSPFELWLFCLRGLIHHKPFWRHHVKPATFGEGEKPETTRPGTPCHTLFEQWVGPAELWTMKSYVTGPWVSRSYPRKLESLTIYRCNYKSGALKDPECWSGQV